MKKAALTDAARAQRSERAARTILAPLPAATVCPAAPECRRRWLIDEHNRVTFGHCYQALGRDTLAAILAGRA